MQPERVKAFKKRAQLRDWFERNHASGKELFLRCFKVHAADRGVTYRDALDEALCCGWIDGVRHSLDADSFSQRFMPRRAESKWSLVNRKRIAELDSQGLLTPTGRAVWKAASTKPTGYSSENRNVELAPKDVARLKSDKKAWAYFEQQAPWYRRTSGFWVMQAKQEATREHRLQQLIECSAAGKPIAPLTRKPSSPPKPSSPRKRGPISS